MKTSAIVFILASLITTTAACSSGEFETLANEAEGIYQVQSHTENLASCEPGGESLLDPGSDQYLVARKQEIFGTPIMYIWSCASPADCRNKLTRIDAGEFVAIDFSFTLSSVDGGSLAGLTANTGFYMNGTCTEGGTADISLSVDADGLTLVEARTIADDYSADSDGFCTTDLAQDAAAGNECSEMETLTAVFVESL